VSEVAQLDDYRVPEPPPLSKYAPEWHQRAACSAELDAPPNTPQFVDRFLTDEVSSVDFRQYPEPVLRTLQICWECPVRRPCLEQAYAQEVHVDDEDKYAPKWVEDGTREGIWGGTPGRIRSLFSHHVDRLDACEDWLQMVALEREFGKAKVTDATWDADEAYQRRLAAQMADWGQGSPSTLRASGA
jgi:hypothetical protein